MNPPANKSVELIEACKGFAIFLVVAAHLVQYGTLGVPQIYASFKVTVYLFHMPLFMFLSGYVYYRASHDLRATANFKTYAAQRTDRLLIPFVGMALLLLGGKFLASHWFYVNFVPETLTDGLIGLVWNTEQSPVFTIWYLFVLFVLSLLMPWLGLLVRRNWTILIGLALVVYFIPVPDILYLNRVSGFMIFFVLGGWASALETMERPSWKIWVWMPLTVALVLALYFLRDRTFGLLVGGALACAVVPQLIRMTPSSVQRGLVWLGGYSMTIYLFNVPVIGVVKALALKFGFGQPNLIWLLLLLLLLTGLFVPILLYEIVSRSPSLRRIKIYLK